MTKGDGEIKVMALLHKKPRFKRSKFIENKTGDESKLRKSIIPRPFSLSKRP